MPSEKRTVQISLFDDSKAKIALVFTGAVLAFPLSSTAQSVPAAQYGGTILVGADDGYTTWPIDGPGTYAHTVEGSKGGSATTTLGISTQPSPSLSLTSSVSGPEVNGVIADTNTYGSFPYGALLVYSVEFLGPAGPVPIQVNARFGASLSPIAPGAFGNEISSATLVVGPASGGQEFGDSVYLQASPPASPFGYTADYAGNFSYPTYSAVSGIAGSLVDSHVWVAQTNVQYTVSLSLYNALDLSGALGGGSMNASAFVDPTFLISSLAANPSLYSVAISDGIGNVAAAVPEPQALAMVLWGVGLIGLMTRKRWAAAKPAA